MPLNFHRIAYEALAVCNATSLDRIDAALGLTAIRPGLRAIDIGCANACVSIHLAERFGLVVEAVELDETMAELAEARITASSVAAQITLHKTRSDTVLPKHGPYDLIVALGTTEPTGPGIREPEAMLSGLALHLASGGHLLWGDLVWTAEPPGPLRQIVELQNRYRSDDGWRQAARSAGLSVRFGHVSSAEDWDHYTQTMLTAVHHWMETHPGHAELQAVSERARQVEMMLDFGRGYMNFGLYLLAHP